MTDKKLAQLRQTVIKLNHQPSTWKELGMHYNTLNSYVRKGYMTKEGSTYSLTRKGDMVAQIQECAQDTEYFVLRKADRRLGIMCSFDGSDILDAWDKPYELDEEGEYFSTIRSFVNEEFIHGR